MYTTPFARTVRRFFSIVFIVLAISFANAIPALASGLTLRVVTDANYPPMEFFKGGQRTGFDIDIIEALAKAMGDTVQWIDIDFKGLIPALQSGRADIAASAIYITDERRQAVDFTLPYFAGGLVVIVRKGSGIHTVKDLDGRKVSVQVGTKSVEFLRTNYPQIERVEVDKNQEMFNLLLVGRADAIVTGRPAATWFVRASPGLVILPDSLTKEQYGFALAKNNPQLKTALDAALEAIKANGTYDRIVLKWFGEASQ